MRIKYCGPARDYSGYGEAVRHDIAALETAGVDVIAQVPQYVFDNSDFGKLSVLVDRCAAKEGEYKVKIIHTTPNIWGKYIEPGKYHIGRLIWETNKLPPDFVAGALLMDEIWTGCEYTKQAIIDSGVNKPIKVIPEAIDFDSIPPVNTYEIPTPKHFNFYGIFEWSERKNPHAFLTAYWKEFKEKDNVALYLKTFYENFNQAKQRELINQIKSLKKSLLLPYYAPVYVVDYLMDRHQVYRLHNTMDCFVSPHRGEGWGIPQMEAMVCGKPVISTNLGGIHEWMHNGDDSYLIDYDLVPITKSVKNPQWYTQDMEWAEINSKGLRVALRFAYEQQNKENVRIAKNGLELVKKNFSTDVVGEIMKKELKNINI